MQQDQLLRRRGHATTAIFEVIAVTLVAVGVFNECFKGSFALVLRGPILAVFRPSSP